MTKEEARLWCGMFKIVYGPKPRKRPLSRARKKKRGLRYCRYAGYGFRWFRGRRAPDPVERATMKRVVELRETRFSWFEIAMQLMEERVTTRHGRENSVSRVRRLYCAEMRLRSENRE